MSWSWSHTAEGVRAARENLFAMPKEELEVIWAEWKAYDSAERKSFWQGFDQAVYALELEEARKTDRHSLAEYIWERAEGQETCDNGGWNAWMCPYGCGPHCVDFSTTLAGEDR